MKKHNIAHNFVIAVIFTCLYAFFLTTEPGPGVQSSMMVALDFSSMLSLAFLVGIGYIVTLGAVMLFSIILSYFMDKNDDFFDSVLDNANICCKVTSAIAFFSVALGFVSWGGT